MKPLISIVLCTYNNADSLIITLTQLANQKLQNGDDIEVIIVNNNSPDHTAAAMKQFLATQFGNRFRYFFEPKQGLSNARNTGVAMAKGDYILFTDDDAEIPKDWTQNYIEVIQQYQPDCLYSKIEIIWDQKKPWWFIPEYTPYFVGLDYGNQVISITDIHKEFYGKNFCVRAALLQNIGGFDPNLGRNGTKLAAGEETLIYRNLVQSGKKLIYFPNAGVGHRLKQREYAAQNIKNLFIDGAYSSYHLATLSARKKIFGRPLRLLIDAFVNLIKATLLLPCNLLTFNKARSYYHYLCLRRNFTLIKLWIFD